jgi:hypothetical protein
VLDLMRGLVALGVALVVVSGCSSGLPPEPPFQVTPDPTLLGTPVPQPSTRTPEPTPSPTPSVALGVNEIAVGEDVAITRDGVSWAALRVTEVVIERSFAETDGRGRDTPERIGHVFVAANVTISALADAVAFDLAGFRATTDSAAEVTLAFSDLGPKPDLLPGTLASRGDSAAGWLIFEAPEAGRVRLTYASDSATTAPLEIVLRGS